MSDEELWKLIEEVENDSMHKAPDYLKEMTLQKIKTEKTDRSQNQTKQFLYYKVRVFGAMAASLVILFALPQPETIRRPEHPPVVQTVHEKSNEICDFLNRFSNDLLLKGGF